MYATFNKNHAKLYDDNGMIIRQYNVRGNVIQVNVSGDPIHGSVMVVDDTGTTTLFDTKGMIIRKTKSKR